MSVNNSSHFSHDLSLDEIPGFEVQEELATPGASSDIGQESALYSTPMY